MTPEMFDIADLAQLGWDERWSTRAAQLALTVPDIGRVIAQHRGFWTVASVGGVVVADLLGRFRLGPQLDVPAVGDWVHVVRREGGATIHQVIERSTALVRMASGGATEPQVIAANVDTVLVVSAIDQPANERRIERQLATVWESGATPVLVATKADLCDHAAFAVRVQSLERFGVAMIITSARTGQGLRELDSHCRPGHTLALLGTSGAGKSTIANAILGSDVMAVNDVALIGKGRHTTTHRQMLVLPTGALLIDTPGMRELGLWVAADEAGLSETFADIVDRAAQCRFSNCGHDGDSGCAIQEALADGELEAERVDSWKKLQRELAWAERRNDARLQADDRKKWAAVAKHAKRRARP